MEEQLCPIVDIAECMGDPSAFIIVIIIIIIHVSCKAHITFFLKSLCAWTPQTLGIREEEE